MTRTSGSSPRVRGTAPSAARRRAAARFIPACAGNGPRPGSTPRARSVHPRVCGERRVTTSSVWGSTGSSPRVRGTDDVHEIGPRNNRFIPACAGNGVSSYRTLRYRTVHPRVCGERRASSWLAWLLLGSSPRVRGTGLAAAVIPRWRRFIPACAGNGDRPASSPTSSTVHPRVCGERQRRAPGLPTIVGSSPRVRGTAAARSRPADYRRFIPACAGNGIASPTLRVPSTVHPRVCGERWPRSTGFPLGGGSSPRVRGTVPGLHFDPHTRRFIPACAGNGLPSGRGPTATTVHPRVCGERYDWTPAGLVRTGSSPRVRGTGRYTASH